MQQAKRSLNPAQRRFQFSTKKCFPLSPHFIACGMRHDLSTFCPTYFVHLHPLVSLATWRTPRPRPRRPPPLWLGPKSTSGSSATGGVETRDRRSVETETHGRLRGLARMEPRRLAQVGLPLQRMRLPSGRGEKHGPRMRSQAYRHFYTVNQIGSGV